MSHVGTSLSLNPLMPPGLGDGMEVDTGLLSAFLQQFGPEESVCAAVAIAADAYRVFDADSRRRISSGPQDSLVAQAERVGDYLSS